MCGITGYYGNKDAYPILLKSLKILEYRGYDSWGIATKQEKKVFLEKHTGRIFENSKVKKSKVKKGNIGIAHTRWATSSKVTKENSHPHTSNDQEVYIVHNGIVENYSELKIFLEEHGITLKTKTDSEIIPNLISLFLKENNLKSSIEKTMQKLKGSYAFIGILKSSAELFFARNGSPLVIGHAINELFFASDVTAFLEHTKNVIFLDDEEYGYCNNHHLKIFKKGNEIKKEIKKISWSVEQAKKGEYPHFMLKEINEQKITIKRAIEQDEKLIKEVTEYLQKSSGIFLVGCGTSYHACISASYQFSHIAKKHVNVILASEFRNYKEFLKPETLMIAVSQSGETADLIDAVKIAKKRGVKIISIVNVIGSTIDRLADKTIIINAGPEICVLSTKSYTSQLAILLLLAYSVAVRISEGKKLINEVVKQVPQLIKNSTAKLKVLAKKLKNQKSIFLIGRDLAYPSTLEGALKIKEVSYIHAEGFAGGELKHGTIALIEQGTPVIVLTTNSTRKLILNNALEVKCRGGYIIGVDSKKEEVYDFFIKVPELGPANPITMIIPLQILAYYLALERGCDVDCPRNLAKSITVR